MGHSHDHTRSDNIRFAFFLNLLFTFIEIIGGLYTNSLAVLSDALHDAGDSVVLGLAWYFQKVSGKKRDTNYSYGYRRYSILGAVINIIILIVGSILIIIAAIPRLLNPAEPDATGMIVLSIIGIAFNGLAFLKLKNGHSHNERVVGLHILEDVLGWVAILIGSIIMYFFDLPIIDPILSLLIALYILYNAAKNLKSTIGIILQKIPDDFQTKDIVNALTELEGVCDVHDLRAWTMDGEFNVLTAHLVLDTIDYSVDLVMLKQEAKRILSERGIHHSTLEFETRNEQCSLE
jgi:cobalt-zinc-cadmium efflux system protein